MENDNGVNCTIVVSDGVVEDGEGRGGARRKDRRGERRRAIEISRVWINAAWQLRERGTLPVKGKTRVKESCPFSRSTGILPAPTVRCITRFYYAVNCSDCCVSLAISAASRVCTRVRARALSLFPRLFFFSFLFPAPLPPPPSFSFGKPCTVFTS